MTSCPVCYEGYADEGEHVPHKLKCGDTMCFQCIDSELIDGEFYCPECGAAHKGERVIDFSIALMAADLGSKYTSDEGTSDEERSSRSSRSNSADSSPRYDSKHSSFGRRLSTRTPCKEPDCDKKAISNGYCLKHTKHLSKSVLGLEQLANEMIEHHDLRNFKSSSHHLRRSELEQTRTSIISDPVALMAKFKAQERIELGEALDLIMRAKAVMSREPNILRLDAPVIVVGDVHGQFFDLVNIMNEAAKSTGKGLDSELAGPMYLFLGDYVDRGQYSCEVMLYLLSLKVAFPERVWLVRGNHECASVSGHFGFKNECKTKYGMNIYYSFLLMFQTMPLGAIISTAFGDIYACHGGLSPGLQTIESIEVLDRMVEPESNPNLMDILWADPISDENVENMSAEQYQEFINIDWRPNPSRGCSYCYGYRTVKRFLETNQLVCLVRAHEVQEEGYRKHFAPEIMESKIVTLQQKMHRAALAKEVAAAARMHSLHSIQGLQIDTGDGGESEVISTLDPLGEMSTPSAAGVRERMFGGVGAVVAVVAGGAGGNGNKGEPLSTPPHTTATTTDTDTTTDITTTNPTHSSSMYSKRGSPYRPDTCSTASIEQPEDFPPVITIFSAPNYCDRYHNKGAILLIDSALNGFRVIQYDCVEHPKTEVRESQTKTLIDLVIATCPYMPTSFRNFVRLAVELGEDVDLDSVNSDNGSGTGSGSDDDSVGGEIVPFLEENVDGGCADNTADGKGVVDGVNNVHNSSSGSSSSSRPGSRPSSVQRMHTHHTNTTHSPNGTQSGNTSPYDATLHLDHPNTLDPTNPNVTNASIEQEIHSASTTTLPTPPKFTRRASKTISLVRQNSLTVPFPVVIQPQPGSGNGVDGVGVVAGSVGGESECLNEENSEEMDVPHSAHMHTIPPLPQLDSDSNENTNPNTTYHNHTTTNATDSTTTTTNTTTANPAITDTGRLVKRKSNVYIQALASDAINEAHPVRLNLYLEEFKKTYETSLKKGFQISLFELSSDEKPAISVNDLKKRFESRSSNHFGGGNSNNNSFATNERPFAPHHPNKEVVHDFERGTGISSIMNMFGGSGRISSSGKFRTSFSTAPDTSEAEAGERRRSAGVAGGDSIGFRNDFYGNSYKGAPKVASHRHSTGGVNALSLKSLSSDSYHSGFHSAGHSPVKPPSSSSVPRDLSPQRADSSDGADPRTAALLSMRHTEPARHLFSSTSSAASTTSEVPHTADTLDTLETAASSADGATGEEAGALDRTPSDSVLFTQSEIMGLRLMFSLFDRSGSNKIAYGDLVAYAEETDDAMGIRDAATALEILDLDGDGFIGILDFIYFARRLKKMHQLAEREEGPHL